MLKSQLLRMLTKDAVTVTPQHPERFDETARSQMKRENIQA